MGGASHTEGYSGTDSSKYHVHVVGGGVAYQGYSKRLHPAPSLVGEAGGTSFR